MDHGHGAKGEDEESHGEHEIITQPTYIRRQLIYLFLILTPFFSKGKGFDHDFQSDGTNIFEKTQLGDLEILHSFKWAYDIDTIEAQHVTFSEGMVPAELSKNTYLHIDFPAREFNRDAFLRTDSVQYHIGEASFTSQLLSDFYVKGLSSGEHQISVYRFKDGDTLHFDYVAKNGFVVALNTNGEEEVDEPWITNQAAVFGLMCLILGFVFYTSDNPKFKKFYTILPGLVLCYLIPALLNTFGVISGETVGLYKPIKTYLLPASLVLMTLAIDFKGIARLGKKAVIMFFTATAGIIIGGPLAIMIVGSFSPETVGGIGDAAAWKGFATLAGSWIGGGANQQAMLDLYGYDMKLYTGMVAVDIGVAAIWMTVLLYGAGKATKIDKWLKADSSAIEKLKTSLSDYQGSIARVPSSKDLMVILGIAFGAVGISHFLGEELSTWFVETFPDNLDLPFASQFFWVVVLTTTIGIILSTTKMREYEGAGASKIGTVFIYLLVVAIGMNMDLQKIVETPMLLLVGIIWMAIHVIILIIVAKIIKAPFFFVAVGSKANVGGAASAPVVASAFHPSLAPVGALLAVLGYAVGTYGAILCAQMMQSVAP